MDKNSAAVHASTKRSGCVDASCIPFYLLLADNLFRPPYLRFRANVIEAAALILAT